MSPQALRSLASAAVLGGACWLVLAATAVTSASRPNDEAVSLSSTADYVGHGAFAAALALTVAGLFALHAHQRGADGRLGSVGTAIAMAGAAGQCVVISTIVATGEEPSWFGVAAPLAILTWVVGSIVLGVALRRAAVMPGWVGVALPIVTALAIAGSELGTSVLIGGYLIVIGARIARAANVGAASRPSVAEGSV